MNEPAKVSFGVHLGAEELDGGAAALREREQLGVHAARPGDHFQKTTREVQVVGLGEVVMVHRIQFHTQEMIVWVVQLTIHRQTMHGHTKQEFTLRLSEKETDLFSEDMQIMTLENV